MTEEVKPYVLKEAIAEAIMEFRNFPSRTLVHANVIARNHAPSNMSQVKELIAADAWFLYLEAKPGYHIIDVIHAAATEYILNEILKAWNEDVAKKSRASRAGGLSKQRM